MENFGGNFSDIVQGGANSGARNIEGGFRGRFEDGFRGRFGSGFRGGLGRRTSVLSLSEAHSWLVAAIFVIGNLIVPQAVHMIPGGGAIVGPIYFLTLFAAMRYGVGVGLLTAVLSPVVNNLLFGMPPDAVLPGVVARSVLIALAGAWSVRVLLRSFLHRP